MSYDPKYQEWVKKLMKGLQMNEIHQIYRGVPILKVKLGENSSQYRFMSPLGADTQFDRLCENIDKRVDREKKSSGQKKSPIHRDTQDSDALTYIRKWEECQMELEKMKKREAGILSKVEELQVKVDELSSARTQLQKEAADLRNQVKASQSMVSDLKNKNK